VPQNEITKAVRSLRAGLGDTQQQFAHRLGMAISTVVRYELSRPPRGKVLADLERLAVSNGCFREAAIFRNAFYEEFELCGAGSASPTPFPYLRLAPRDDHEEELVQSLLWAARYSESGTTLQNIEKRLKNYRLAKAQFEAAINDAAIEFLLVDLWAADGLAAEDIAERVGGTPERHKVWLAVRETLGTDVPSFRALLQGIGLGEPDTGLAASFQVPISTIGMLKKNLPELAIRIINKALHETKAKQKKRRDRE
jgi:transcriptional regulator with XRE-family HTH domain